MEREDYELAYWSGYYSDIWESNPYSMDEMLFMMVWRKGRTQARRDEQK